MAVIRFDIPTTQKYNTVVLILIAVLYQYVTRVCRKGDSPKTNRNAFRKTHIYRYLLYI